MKKTSLGAQGEISFFLVEGGLPTGLSLHTEIDHMKRPIISHSESGSHHVLAADVAVFEKPNAPRGMRILYALLDHPVDLIQDASDPHGSHTLPAGLIEFRIAREYDPFSEQIRRVAD